VSGSFLAGLCPTRFTTVTATARRAGFARVVVSLQLCQEGMDLVAVGPPYADAPTVSLGQFGATPTGRQGP
jgi:hypothetical protein